MSNIFGKLKLLKGKLKSLDKLNFSHIFYRVKSTVTDLENSQLLLDANSSNSLLRENIKALRAKTSFLCEVEISFLSQKAKCHFLANNDKNTKFFHCIVKRNHGRNHISSILGKDGVLTTSFEQVVTDFERFYYYLFGVETQRTPTGPCVFVFDMSL
ncbi:hypothetical protein ACS0TY_019645 [Phlomoides rotata]